MLGVERPSVGLLNVGVEEIKGIEEVKAAGRILREADFPHMNYIGFVEGDDIGKGTADVVVAEGFTGNIALKTAEGTAKLISGFLKEAMGSTLMSRIGYLFARGAFESLKERMDPRRFNGAVFLGLEGIVIKSHGGADALGFSGAIDIAREMARQQLLTKIGEMIAQSRTGARRQSNRRRLRPPRAAQLTQNPGASLTGTRHIWRSVVEGVGSCLPERRVTNSELEKTVDTTDEWIVQRTGIRERHIAGPGETTSVLATRAAEQAMERAGCTAGDIDLIVLATSTPDFTFPSTATQVQAALGVTRGAAFDVQAVCSGFVYAVAIADKFLSSGSHERALVIGAETFSRILDWEDRTTCVSLWRRCRRDRSRAQGGEGTIADRGVLTTHLRSDGRHREKLYVDGGPSTTGTVGKLRMSGKEVFRHAVGMVTDVMTDAFEATGWTQTISTGSCRTRRTSASSTPRPTSSASRARRS